MRSRFTVTIQNHNLLPELFPEFIEFWEQFETVYSRKKYCCVFGGTVKACCSNQTKQLLGNVRVETDSNRKGAIKDDRSNCFRHPQAKFYLPPISVGGLKTFSECRSGILQTYLLSSFFTGSCARTRCVIEIACMSERTECPHENVSNGRTRIFTSD